MKKAFTLAEILITLGIIGVVAALTIPSLIKKYQMKTFEVAFKKQYSVLNNTINYLQVNNDLKECYIKLVYVYDPETGKPINGYYDANQSDCNEIKQNLIKMLKLSEIKKYCDFTPFATVIANGGVAVNYSVTYDSILKIMKTFMAPDGTTFMFYYNNTPSGGGYELVNLIVDVNGAKGPNKWGYDVFWLTFSQKNGNLMFADEYASLAEKGGRLPRTILRNSDIQPTRAGYDIQD